MKKIVLIFLTLAFMAVRGLAQQNYYDVTPGDGYGLRFWQDNQYKIHMGNTSEYHFGPVWDYSIKTNMSNTSGRGWTWGTPGQTPVVAFDIFGNGQVLGGFTAGGFKLQNSSDIEFGVGITKDGAAGRIAYQKYSDALDIVGAGTLGSNRKVKFWNEGGAYFTGNVGIGAPSSSTRLDVSGAGAANVDLKVNGRIATGDSGNNGGVWVDGAQTIFIGQYATTSLGFYNNLAWRMVVDNNGNVGIGTGTPNQKLTVNGTIYGKEVKVDLSVPGPDYVFEESYALPSLEEVKSYIDENKHLPEVPSAKEMEKNGINLSEMNMLLLKKVEELTLYVVELNKKNENMEKRLRNLENK